MISREESPTWSTQDARRKLNCSESKNGDELPSWDTLEATLNRRLCNYGNALLESLETDESIGRNCVAKSREWFLRSSRCFQGNEFFISRRVGGNCLGGIAFTFQHVANTPDAPPVPDTSLLRYMFIDFDTWPTFSNSWSAAEQLATRLSCFCNRQVNVSLGRYLVELW